MVCSGELIQTSLRFKLDTHLMNKSRHKSMWENQILIAQCTTYLKVEYLVSNSTQNDSGFDLWHFLTVRVWRCGWGWESSNKVSSLENCDLRWLGRCRWCHGLCLIMVTHFDLCHAANTHHTNHPSLQDVVGCCHLMLIKTICQLPSTTQTRNMSANQTMILLGMKKS